MLSVQLANISTRCSSYPQGKVKQGAKFIEVAPELVCVCSPESGGTLTLAQLEYTPPPTSSWSPSSSLVTRNSILVELAGVVWMCKASFTLNWTGLAALSKYPYIFPLHLVLLIPLMLCDYILHSRGTSGQNTTLRSQGSPSSPLKRHIKSKQNHLRRLKAWMKCKQKHPELRPDTHVHYCH